MSEDDYSRYTSDRTMDGRQLPGSDGSSAARKKQLNKHADVAAEVVDAVLKRESDSGYKLVNAVPIHNHMGGLWGYSLFFRLGA